MIRITGEHRKLLPLLRKEFGITLKEYLTMTYDEIQMYIDFLLMDKKGQENTQEDYKKILDKTLKKFQELRKIDIQLLKRI